MNVSHENAQESLSTIQDVTVRTHRAIASTYANPFMILWGALCIIAFTASHFYLAHAFYIFMVMNVVGGIGTAVMHAFELKLQNAFFNFEASVAEQISNR